MDASDAISEQLSFASNAENGLSELAKCMGPRKFVAAAIAHSQFQRLVNQVVSECVADLSLLDLCSVAEGAWRRVLSKVIRNAADRINRSQILDEQIDVTWRLQVEGALDDGKYLESLSKTKYADLLRQENRAAIWHTLPSDLLEVFCSTTAESWADQLAIDDSIARPEEPLCNEVLSGKYRERLLPVEEVNSVVKSLNAFQEFPELGPSDFDDWRVRLLTAQGYLSKSDSQADWCVCR